MVGTDPLHFSTTGEGSEHPIRHPLPSDPQVSPVFQKPGSTPGGDIPSTYPVGDIRSVTRNALKRVNALKRLSVRGSLSSLRTAYPVYPSLTAAYPASGQPIQPRAAYFSIGQHTLVSGQPFLYRGSIYGIRTVSGSIYSIGAAFPVSGQYRIVPGSIASVTQCDAIEWRPRPPTSYTAPHLSPTGTGLTARGPVASSVLGPYTSRGNYQRGIDEVSTRGTVWSVTKDAL